MEGGGRGAGAGEVEGMSILWMYLFVLIILVYIYLFVSELHDGSITRRLWRRTKNSKIVTDERKREEKNGDDVRYRGRQVEDHLQVSPVVKPPQSVNDEVSFSVYEALMKQKEEIKRERALMTKQLMEKRENHVVEGRFENYRFEYFNNGKIALERHQDSLGQARSTARRIADEYEELVRIYEWRDCEWVWVDRIYPSSWAD